MSVVAVDGLVKRFGATTALDDGGAAITAEVVP